MNKLFTFFKTFCLIILIGFPHHLNSTEFEGEDKNYPKVFKENVLKEIVTKASDKVFIDEIKKSHTEILYDAKKLYSQAIVEELVSAHNRHVNVVILTNQSGETDHKSKNNFKVLLARDIQVKVNDRKTTFAPLHNMMVDNTTLIASIMDESQANLTPNCPATEDVIIVKDQAYINRYKGIFYDRYSKSHSYGESKKRNKFKTLNS